MPAPYSPRASDSQPHTDPALDAQIGQMIMVGFRGTSVSPADPIMLAIRAGRVGGVWLCDYVSPAGERLGNITSPEQLRTLITNLQQAAPTPLLITLDAEGGAVIRLKPEYGFPPTHSAAELGQRDPAATTTAAAAIAATLRDLGVNLNLAPVADLNRAPANPALGGKARCFSHDPAVVTAHAEAFIRSHAAAGVACAIKHFPGQGSALADAHHAIADITATWSQEELAPFRACLQPDLAPAVLTGHLLHRDFDAKLPASLSRALTTGLLRSALGFDGVVICDDLGMGAIRDHFAFDAAIVHAVNAGADIILHANTGLHFPDIAARTFNAITQAVTTGRISEDRINSAYQRIVRLKVAWRRGIEGSAEARA